MERIENGTDHPIDVTGHLIVPKTKYLIAFRFKVLCSLSIILHPIEMLTPVQFDDEFLSWSTKVSNEFSNGMLPSKGDAQLVVPYSGPKFCFSRRRLFS